MSELDWKQKYLLEHVETIDLYKFMNVIAEIGWAIKESAQQGASEERWLDSQAMCVVEEAGEFIGEWRRLQGFARRPGTKQQMLSELADVIISASMMFNFLHEDDEEVSMHDEVKKKLVKIVTRGYVNKES